MNELYKRLPRFLWDGGHVKPANRLNAVRIQSKTKAKVSFKYKDQTI